MKKNLYLGILLTAVISVSLSYYFFLYPKELEGNVYQQNGYEVDDAEELTITFDLDENWLDVTTGETKVFNDVLYENYISTLYLESVHNDSGRYNFEFNIKHNFNAENGEFLSHYEIMNNGGEVSFTSKEEIINLYNQNQQLISLPYRSGGSGPGESFGRGFNSSLLESVEEVELSLYLYEYNKY